MAPRSESEAELPRPQRESTASRNLLSTVASAMFVGGCLLICGLCVAGLYFFQPDVRDDPEEVAPLMAEMLDITVPPEFEARGVIEWNVAFLISMRGAYFEMPDAESEGMLIFVEVQSSMQGPDVEAHIRQALREKGGGVRELEVVGEAEQLDFVVGGELIQFTSETRIDPATDHTYRVIDGVVDGKSGSPVRICMSVREQWTRDGATVEWDSATVEEMIESIR